VKREPLYVSIWKRQHTPATPSTWSHEVCLGGGYIRKHPCDALAPRGIKCRMLPNRGTAQYDCCSSTTATESSTDDDAPILPGSSLVLPPTSKIAIGNSTNARPPTHPRPPSTLHPPGGNGGVMIAPMLWLHKESHTTTTHSANEASAKNTHKGKWCHTVHSQHMDADDWHAHSISSSTFDLGIRESSAWQHARRNALKQAEFCWVHQTRQHRGSGLATEHVQLLGRASQTTRNIQSQGCSGFPANLIGTIPQGLAL
jgi:hypothetical protein